MLEPKDSGMVQELLKVHSLPHGSVKIEWLGC